MGSVCLAQPVFLSLLQFSSPALFFLLRSQVVERETPPPPHPPPPIFSCITLLLFVLFSTDVHSVILGSEMMTFQLLSSFTPQLEMQVLFPRDFNL